MTNNKNDITVIQNDLIPDVKLNLKSQEQFINDKGIVLEHWAAIPSTIGQKDRGDYRRPDSLDTISENGYIYKKIGEFSGVIVGNHKKNTFQEGGIFDNSTARLILPKFYVNSEKEILLLPGDRLYAKNIELKVANYQKMQFDPKRSDILQFPAKNIVFLRDSKNIEYFYKKDFTINENGNILWKKEGNNPGTDPETGKGRLYGIRYTYLAFWYVQQLLNEIRVTNTSDSSQPSRLPYHAVIQREYVYHNRNRGDSKESKDKNITNRTTEQPKENIDPNDDIYQVNVEVKNFE